MDPIPMLLWCPFCGERHIDTGVFAMKPHHTHACQKCGGVWRPAVLKTVGVRHLPGFKDTAPSDLQELHNTRQATLLQLPDGTVVAQGSDADRETWWTCGSCDHCGPFVGKAHNGAYRCLGSCGGVTPNPDVPREIEGPNG